MADGIGSEHGLSLLALPRHLPTESDFCTVVYNLIRDAQRGFYALFVVNQDRDCSRNFQPGKIHDHGLFETIHRQQPA